MGQVLYADVYFLINFGMDLLSLSLTGRFLRISPAMPRFVAAAAVGALWSTAAVCLTALSEKTVLTGVLSAFISLAICFIAMGSRDLSVRSARMFLSAWLMFLCVCSLLGGLMTVLFSMRMDLSGSGAASESVPVEFLAVAALSGLSALLFSRIASRRSAARSAKMSLTMNGRTAAFEVLNDSGNLLVEPVSGLPVAVVSWAAVKTLMPELRALSDMSAVNISDSLKTRVRVVPVDGVGKGGVMYAFKPDSATVGGVRRDLFILPEDKPPDAYGGFAGTVNL